MSKQYKHIFFDLDHTLWDFNKNSAIVLKQLYNEYQLEEKGVTSFEDFYTVYTGINEKLWERFRKGSIRRKDLRTKRFSQTLLEFKIGDELLANELNIAYLELLPTQTQLTPYAQQVLDHCKDKYQMHLITNGFDVTQRMKLQYSGIGNYFSEIVTSEKSHSMKPHPVIFEYALNAAKATPEESIMIGDHLEVDITGARDVGMDQVYYNPAKLKHAEQPTHEISCLSELLDIL